MIGLLQTDPMQGRKCVVVKQPLNTSEDEWCREAEETEGADAEGIHRFVEELNELATEPLDFVSTLKRVMEGPQGSDGVREFLGEVLDGRG